MGDTKALSKFLYQSQEVVSRFLTCSKAQSPDWDTLSFYASFPCSKALGPNNKVPLILWYLLVKLSSLPLSAVLSAVRTLL